MKTSDAEDSSESRYREALRQTQQALAETQALYHVATSLIGVKKLSDLLQDVVNHVAEALPADRVALITYDLEAQKVTQFVKGGPGSVNFIQVSFDELWDGLSGWALREMKPALSIDNNDPRESPEVKKRRAETNCGSVIVVPISYRSKAFGTLIAINRPEERIFTQRDVELMEAMASQSALAIENAHLFDELEEYNNKLEQHVAERTAELAESNAHLQEEVAERTRVEKSLQRLNRAFRALSSCNQSLLHATEETALLREACHIIKTVCGYRQVWIGLIAQDGTQAFRPVAQAGFGKRFLEANDPAWADLKQKGNPNGAALRSRRPVIQRAIRTTSAYAAWLGQISTSRLTAFAVFPLLSKGHVLGTLHVYSTSPDTFEPEEVALLTELANDLAYGITALREQGERERVAQALQASEKRYRLLVENMNDGLAMVDKNLMITFVNPRFHNLLGYSAEEMIGRPMESFLDGTNRQAFAAQIAKRRRGEPSVYELGWTTQDGKRISTRVSGTPLLDDKHQFHGSFALVTDITKHKRAEEALRESEEKYRLLYEESFDGLFVTSPEGRILDMNRKGVMMFGYDTKEEVLSLDLEKDVYAHPPDRQWILSMVNAQGTAEYEVVVKKKSGEQMVTLCSLTAVRHEEGRIESYRGIIRDISEKKRAEEERLSHLRFFENMDRVNRAMQGTNDLEQMMSDVLDVVLSIFDSDRAFLMYPCDPEATSWTSPMERNKPEYPGVGSLGFMMPMDADVAATLRILRGSDRPVQFGPGTQYPLPAERFDLKSFMSMVLYPKVGKPWQFGIHQCSYVRIWTSEEERLLQEIGQRLADALTGLLMFRNMQESEQKFRSFVEQSSEGFALVDEEGMVIEWNHALENMTGLAAGQVLRRPFWDVQREMISPKLRTPEHYERAKQIVLDALQTGQSSLFSTAVETEMVRQDGTRQSVQLTIFPIRTGKGYRIGSISSDITKRKQAEDALERQNERLSKLYSVGQVVNSTLDVAEILDFVVDEAMRVSHAKRGLALVVDLTTRVFERRSLRGFTSKEVARVKKVSLKLDQGLNGEAYRSRLVVNVGNVRQHLSYLPLIPITRSELVVPILHADKVLGNIDLQSPETDAFREADIDYLEALAEQAALAIVNARLYHDLEIYSGGLEQAVAERTAELEATKDRVETILSSIGDALLVLHMDGLIEQVNPAFERQTGYSAVEAEFQNHYDLLKFEFGSKGDYQAALETLTPGQIWQGEAKVQRKDGSIYDASLTIAPIRDPQGAIRRLVASIRDITPLKEVERAKDQFVSNVSHELRTPITSLRLNQELLHRNPAGQEVYIERMKRELDRLNDLIENLLRLSRLDQGRGQLNLQPLDINDLVQRYVDDRMPLAESRDLSLSLEGIPGLPLAAADAELLGQALSVLLTNALNYTPAGGRVTIGTHQRNLEGGAWVGFSVSDTGPGIPPSELPGLFTRFFRGAVGRKSGMSGTGLGLAIAREIIERHRGHIEVNSEGVPGHGATFSVWLPAIEHPGRDMTS